MNPKFVLLALVVACVALPTLDAKKAKKSNKSATTTPAPSSASDETEMRKAVKGLVPWGTRDVPISQIPYTIDSTLSASTKKAVLSKIDYVGKKKGVGFKEAVKESFIVSILSHDNCVKNVIDKKHSEISICLTSSGHANIAEIERAVTLGMEANALVIKHQLKKEVKKQDSDEEKSEEEEDSDD